MLKTAKFETKYAKLHTKLQKRRKIMQIFWFILAGLISGVFAGMGMGGGTFLIPILTLFLGVDQRVAQGINLLVFLPMAVVVIIIYAHKKMIDWKGWWLISLPACLVCLLGAFLAFKTPMNILKIVFGIFIILIGLAQIIVLIVSSVKKNKKHK